MLDLLSGLDSAIELNINRFICLVESKPVKQEFLNLYCDLQPKSVTAKRIYIGNQGYQIGPFSKDLCYKFSYKSSPKIWYRLGHFWKIWHFKIKLLWANILGKHWVASGHNAGKYVLGSSPCTCLIYNNYKVIKALCLMCSSKWPNLRRRSHSSLHCEPEN